MNKLRAISVHRKMNLMFDLESLQHEAIEDHAGGFSSVNNSHGNLKSARPPLRSWEKNEIITCSINMVLKSIYEILNFI
jgi:hypothetical protein